MASYGVNGLYGIKYEGYNPSDGTDSTYNLEYGKGIPITSDKPAGTNDFSITQATATPNYTYQVAPTTGSDNIVEVQWFAAAVVTGSLVIGERIEYDASSNQLTNRDGIDAAITLTPADVFAVVRFVTGEIVVKTTATLS